MINILKLFMSDPGFLVSGFSILSRRYWIVCLFLLRPLETSA